MENLNAEEVKRALELCQEPTMENCAKCPYINVPRIKGKDCLSKCYEDTVALITSQEQRIKELQNCVEYLSSADELVTAKDNRIKELTEENSEVKANWQKLKESHEGACEECRAEFKRLTEENERLKGERKLCYKCGKYYLSAWSQCPYCLTKPDIANDVKTETVRKMQERLKEYLDDFYTTSEDAFLDVPDLIDQIAKEMLEEK